MSYLTEYERNTLDQSALQRGVKGHRDYYDQMWGRRDANGDDGDKRPVKSFQEDRAERQGALCRWSPPGAPLGDFPRGICAYCGDRFLFTVDDEPGRTWCGACPAGESERTPVRRNHGFARKGLVPSGIGTPRVCGKCDKWFAARPRETVCDGCVPAEKRTLRALKDAPKGAVRTPVSRGGIRPGQRGVKTGVREVFSEYLNLAFRCPVSDPRAASLEYRVSDFEEAAGRRWEHTGHAPGEPPCPRTMHESPETPQEALIASLRQERFHGHDYQPVMDGQGRAALPVLP